MLNLKQKLRERLPLLGTFVKTPHHHAIEVLSNTELDVLCLDAEHAPFGRDSLDASILAARANNTDLLVRITDDSPASILNVLDMGATGVVIPHVKSASQLNDIVRHCYYGNNGRGYAGSTRAAGYTSKTLAQNLETNKQETVVVAQIEDLQALDNIEDICRTEGVDCLFIGRMDLTLALGETDPKAQRVLDAVNKIVTTAARHDKTTGMFVGDLSELDEWIRKGVSLFLLGSDHSFMYSGAKQLRSLFDAAQKGV